MSNIHVQIYIIIVVTYRIMVAEIGMKIVQFLRWVHSSREKQGLAAKWDINDVPSSA